MIEYRFTKQADHQLQRFPHQAQKFVIKKIKYYCSTENPLHYADSIEGERGKVYRYRIGDYRAIFDWEGTRILITKVSHRREAYRE